MIIKVDTAGFKQLPLLVIDRCITMPIQFQMTIAMANDASLWCAKADHLLSETRYPSNME